jgi:hypothetical protein
MAGGLVDSVCVSGRLVVNPVGYGISVPDPDGDPIFQVIPAMFIIGIEKGIMIFLGNVHIIDEFNLFKVL